MGDIGDGIRAYQKVIDMQPNHREAWVNMAQARKEVSPSPPTMQSQVGGCGVCSVLPHIATYLLLAAASA